MKAQDWLDTNYPKENRSEEWKIHLNEPSLEGDLDLSDFTYKSLYYPHDGVKVYISLSVDSNQITIKNLPKRGEVIELAAQKWLEQNYPKNGTCIRKGSVGENHKDFGKARSKIIKLDIRLRNLEGDLDLSDFINLKELKCYGNKLTSLNLSNCSQLEEIDCHNNQLTNLTLPANPTKLKKLDLHNNNFANQDLSFLVGAVNLEKLDLWNTHFTGSLDYLSEMKCLKELDISNTDINEVNKLPRSLEYKNIEYSTYQRPNCQLIKIIPQLKRFGEFGWCQKCHQLNTSKDWCQPCAEQEWQADLKELTGQELIEKFIKQQRENKKEEEWKRTKLQWIPYEKFTNIKYLAEGGFSKIYKAKWGKDKKGNDIIVVLKSLTNSQNITLEFLQEISNTKLVDSRGSNVVKCHGISQDPKTKNYLMVMEYIKDGNLQQYLKNNFKGLSWKNKIRKLKSVVEGLKDIHKQNLVHRDFHSGNILNYNLSSYITDLGLSRLASSQKEEGEIFGVIPYVAPEVLQGQPYTQAADIYSFGIIAYEILSGLPPYYNIPHDPILGARICVGLRPQFQTKIPALLENLINKCWHTDPTQRPSAKELREILDGWYNEINDKKTTQFTQQIQEADTHNQTLPQEIRFPKYELHQGAVYHSKAINTKQITQLLQTLSIDNLSGEQSAYQTTQIDFEIPQEITDPQEESSTQAQIEIPPKSGK